MFQEFLLCNYYLSISMKWNNCFVGSVSDLRQQLTYHFNCDTNVKIHTSHFGSADIWNAEVPQKSLSADCGLQTCRRNVVMSVHSTCVLQVKKVLEKLYENKKIASATHNVYAYRSVRLKAPFLL